LLQDDAVYSVIVSKIIDHLKVELGKSKKESSSDKLAELKRVFYQINRRSFVQKFIEPPMLIKSSKSSFQYYIPTHEVQPIVDEFVQVLTKDCPFTSGSLMYPTLPKNNNTYSLRGNDLWFGLPISNVNNGSIKSIMKVLTKQDVTHFLGATNFDYEEVMKTCQHQGVEYLAYDLEYSSSNNNNTSTDITLNVYDSLTRNVIQCCRANVMNLEVEYKVSL
jgi:hypothetical protein